MARAIAAGTGQLDELRFRGGGGLHVQHDEEVVLRLKQNFEFLIDGWRSARVAKIQESLG